jgi:hypothetical protein
VLCALALTLTAGVTAAGATAAGATAAGAATASALTGKVIGVGSTSFTLQTNGTQVGVINALIRAATKITDEDTPYVWGGGHAEAGVPSVGIKGPGYNGKTAGFDCSGSVAAVLAGAGLWPAGAGVPADNGVISELMADHLIAAGVGTGPDSVDLYDDPGVHIFMSIDGRFFGTSDGDGGGDAAGGAGWLDDGADDASNHAFKTYHVLPSALKQKTSWGTDYTFQLSSDGLFAATEKNLAVSLGDLPVSDLLSGERVRVSYTAQSTGMLAVDSVAIISGGPGLSPPTTTTTTPTTPTPTTTTTTTTTPTTTVTPPRGTPVLPVPSVTGTPPAGSGSGSPGSSYQSTGPNGGSGFGSGGGLSPTTGGAGVGGA